MSTKLILESPFANTNPTIFNENYYYLCMCARKMMLEQGASPLFFHALYTQFLHDDIQEERNIGLFRSFNWHSDAHNKTYAIDRKISKGMILGAEDAIKKGIPVFFYTALPEDHEIAKKVAEINAIEDDKTRWDTGLDFINSLEMFDEENGDLTEYRSYNLDLLKDVYQCIIEFFAPLVDDIRNRHPEFKSSKAAA